MNPKYNGGCMKEVEKVLIWFFALLFVVVGFYSHNEEKKMVAEKAAKKAQNPFMVRGGKALC